MEINSMLNPKSIAIIGASNNKKKVGNQILNNLMSGGYKGKIYPVNLNDKEVEGLKAYQSVSDLAGKVDLALIVVPAMFVLAEVKKIAEAKIKNIIIISAGFSEIGAEGKKLEQEIEKFGSENNLNILGPNCFGIINSVSNLNLTFAKSKIKKGRVAFVSQSGAIGSAVLDWLTDKNFGLSHFVSLGNEMILDENVFFEQFTNDKNTDLVIAYLEEIKNGQKFMEVVSHLSQKKPVAILLAGKTEEGKVASMSHTGSMAGSTQAAETALHRSGVIVLDNLEEAFSLMKLAEGSVMSKNNEIFLLSNAGGPMVLTVDQLAKNNLKLGKFSPNTIINLRKSLPEVPSVANPLDVIGDATALRYEKALQGILSDKNVNNVLVLLTPQTTTEAEKTALAISKYSQKYKNKLIVASFIGGESLVEAREILARNSVPHFDFPEEAVRVMGMMAGYYEKIKQIRPYCHSERSEESRCARSTRDSSAAGLRMTKLGQLDYLKGFSLLKKYGIKIVENIVIKIESDLNNLKYPVVLKVVGDKIIHKTDDNLLAINLKSVDEARVAFGKFKNILKDQNNFCVAQPMVKGGLEMIIGFKRDESFGPILMVGAGGIYAEVLNDIQLEVDDVDLPRALEMVKKLKVFKILNGARGREKLDIQALAETIVKVAKLARENIGIKEFDINPLFVNKKGVVAVDVRVIT